MQDQDTFLLASQQPVTLAAEAQVGQVCILAHYPNAPWHDVRQVSQYRSQNPHWHMVWPLLIASAA